MPYSCSAIFAEVRVTMDFLKQRRYYRLLKLVLKIFGHWPSQSKLYSWGINISLPLMGVSLVIPVTIAALKHRNDIVIVMEFIHATTVVAMLYIKGFASKWSEPKIVALFDRIRTDWQVWMPNRQVDILHVYAEQGRKMVLVWLGIYSSVPIMVTTQPAMLKIIDILLRNGSKTVAFVVPMDYYYFDEQKYFFYVSLHLLLTLFLAFLHASSFNCIFIVSVQHGCGIFAALGHELSEIGKDVDLSKSKHSSYASNKRNMDSERLAWCIKRHQDAIEYANLIESTFSGSFCITVGLNILVMSVSGYQIAKSSNSIQDTWKFVLGFTASLVQIFVESYMAQILMDHSINIRHCMQSSEWYNLSPKVQMLLYIIMIRSNVPCKITVGKMYIMGLETFLGIFQTSISCLTVLRSM